MPLSRVWGDGRRSSSDGQRFAVERDSLLGAFHPRYFGHYDRALTLYTHTADQSSVYATQAISCAPREAGWVLGGILENDTILEIREHTTDTGGFTEKLWGLCTLLGINFMPRLKDLPDQILYRVDRDADYGPGDPLLRSVVDTAIIHEQWDQLVRIAASLKDRLTPAHVVMQRLNNAGSSDRIAKALTALGRLAKTTHILRYVHEEPLRRAIQLQLNRGEFRHILAKWLFFANHGTFRTGIPPLTLREIRYRTFPHTWAFRPRMRIVSANSVAGAKPSSARALAMSIRRTGPASRRGWAQCDGCRRSRSR